MNFMRGRSWHEEERNDSSVYMSAIQRRIAIPGQENILFYDEESFLIGLVKIGHLKNGNGSRITTSIQIKPSRDFARSLLKFSF